MKKAKTGTKHVQDILVLPDGWKLST